MMMNDRSIRRFHFMSTRFPGVSVPPAWLPLCYDPQSAGCSPTPYHAAVLWNAGVWFQWSQQRTTLAPRFSLVSIRTLHRCLRSGSGSCRRSKPVVIHRVRFEPMNIPSRRIHFSRYLINAARNHPGAPDPQIRHLQTNPL